MIGGYVKDVNRSNLTQHINHANHHVIQAANSAEIISAVVLWCTFDCGASHVISVEHVATDGQQNTLDALLVDICQQVTQHLEDHIIGNIKVIFVPCAFLGSLQSIMEIRQGNDQQINTNFLFRFWKHRRGIGVAQLLKPRSNLFFGHCLRFVHRRNNNFGANLLPPSDCPHTVFA